MKKLKYLLIIICLIVVFPKFVVAAELDHNIIYFVESLNAYSNKDILTLKGYSFISHQDNRGGTNGNLKTYLIAYTGDWKKEYENCSNTLSDDDKKVMCYKIKNTASGDDLTVDHYALRCTKEACSIDMRTKLNSRDVKSFDETGAICASNPNYSHCIYNNVGFKFDVNLNTLYENLDLNGGKKINFRIYSKTNKNSASSDLGVYSAVCKKDGSICDDTTIITKSYSFNLEGLATKIRMDATDAVIQNELGDNAGKGLWKPNNNDGTVSGVYDYTVLEFGYGKSRFVKQGAFDLETGKQAMFKLTGHGIIGWAFLSWLKVPGDVSLKLDKLKPNYVQMQCSDISDFNGEEVTDNTVNCGNNGSYRQCKKTESLSGYVYLESNDVCSDSGGKNKKEQIGGSWYVKVKVTTDVLLYQTATFTFGNPSSKTIYAGKGFELGETKYINNITWMNANRYINNNPYYKYTIYNYEISDSKCVRKSNITLDDKDVYYKNSNNILVKSTLEEASLEVIDQKVRSKIDTGTTVMKNIKFKSCNSNDSSKCKIDNPNKTVSGSWKKASDDTNNYKYNGVLFGKKITNVYTYNLTNSYVVLTGDDAGKAKYIAKANEIKDNYKATGQKYYIDFKWTSSKNYPFNLAKDLNPSFLSEMTWKLNGTCSINVKDGYYGDDSGGSDPEPDGDDSGNSKKVPLFRYRSITVNNPFPKGKIPKNWETWYNKKSNQTRILESYKNMPNNPLYEITLSKFKKKGAVLISDINNITTHYLDMSNIDVNTGISDFVEEYFSIKATVSDKSFCSVGTFNSSGKDNCDVRR